MFKLTNTKIVLRIPDGAQIPMEDGNPDYEDYKKWVLDGNAPQPADPIDQAPNVRATRDARIHAVAWRYERNAREARLGLTQTDNIALLDNYVQALADIPSQAGFPTVVNWPVAP